MKDLRKALEDSTNRIEVYRAKAGSRRQRRRKQVLLKRYICSTANAIKELGDLCRACHDKARYVKPFSASVVEQEGPMDSSFMIATSSYDYQGEKDIIEE